jgi:GntR family transcriptional regulator of arabinose operon
MYKRNYKTIYNDLRSKIDNFEIKPGSLLPTETEMAEKWNVSRPTVTRAYNKLQEDGLVTKCPGYGTEVLEHKGKGLPLYGLLLPGAGESEIFSVITERLLEMASPNTYAVLCDGSGASTAKIRSYFVEACADEYIKKGVDGIIFSPLERVDNADELNARICRKFDDAGIPVVLIDRDICNFPCRSSYDLVCLDNYSAGYIMAQHFIDQGCRKIYYFYRPFSAYSVFQRLSGITAAMRQAGMEISSGDAICAETSEFVLAHPEKLEKGAAVICANDSTAAMLIPDLEAAGYRIGSDILISGFDDMKYAKHLKHPLTTFRQPCEQIAEVAVELIERRLQNKDAAVITANLTGDIVIRKSSIMK